jgi:adenylate cyclase class 2
MNTEVEAKFLHIDHSLFRHKLTDIGATCLIPVRLMRRAIVDYPDRRLQIGSPNSYIRIRDEGDKVTLTYKQFDSLSVDGAREIEVTVSSFEDTINIFTAAGLEVVSFQESKRETWKFTNCEIVLDEWPWLDPYIEIEAATEVEIQEVVSKLGLNWSEAVFGDVMVAYRDQYPYLNETQTVGTIKEVRFDKQFPDSLKENSN